MPLRHPCCEQCTAANTPADEDGDVSRLLQRQVGLDPCCHRSEKSRFRRHLLICKQRSYVTAKVEFILVNPIGISLDG